MPKKIDETKELVKISEQNLANVAWHKMAEETPKQYVQTRAGRGGKSFTYVETGYIVKKLNELFNYLWDFEVIEENVYEKARQISVKGKLTVHLSPTLTITKTQYGSANIKFDSRTQMPLSLGDDKKAAASDALKKCASLFGVASDIYWGGEVEEEEVIEDSVENTPTPSAKTSKVPYISTATGSKRSAYYFALCKQAGLDAENAKKLIKNKLKLESYTDITKEQLDQAITIIDKAIQDKKKAKDDNYIGDEELDNISKQLPNGGGQGF